MATADWAGMCPCRSAGSWAAIGPGVCEFEGVGGLWQEVFPPGGGDDLDAGGRAGGVVVAGGDGAGWPVGLNREVDTAMGELVAGAIVGLVSVPGFQAPMGGGRRAMVGVRRRSRLARKPSAVRRDSCWVVVMAWAWAHEWVVCAASRRARLWGSARSGSVSAMPAPPGFQMVVNAAMRAPGGGSGGGGWWRWGAGGGRAGGGGVERG